MGSIYIVGGSGFIGKNLVDFLRNDYKIFVFDKYIDETFFENRRDVTCYKLDLVKDEIPYKYNTPDYIINLTSIVTAERNLSLFDELISSNLKVLLNLYERFKNTSSLKLFIQFGSSEEYGSMNSPFIETMRECPNSPYALIKQLTVNAALMLHYNYNFPSMAVRPGNLFGKYQNKNKFIPYIIKQLKANQDIEVTQCEQKRDFIYVEDFAWCIEQLIQQHQKCIGEIINVSSGKSISLKEIIEICKKEISSTSRIKYGAKSYRSNEIMNLQCDISKLNDVIGMNVYLDISKRIKDYIKSVL
jgi:UDP-glucose 4-epimerase